MTTLIPPTWTRSCGRYARASSRVRGSKFYAVVGARCSIPWPTAPKIRAMPAWSSMLASRGRAATPSRSWRARARSSTPASALSGRPSCRAHRAAVRAAGARRLNELIGQSVEARSLCRADMIARRLLSLVRVAPCDRAHDAAVLRVRLGSAVRQAKGVAVEQGQRVVHAVERGDQVAIVRGLAHGAMEATVERDQHARIVRVRAELVEDAMKDADLGFAGMLGRKSCGRTFEDLAHGVKLEHLLLAQLGDDQAAACAPDPHSSLLQPPQCVPHGRATNPEGLRDLLLGDTLARCKPAFPDGVAQARKDEFAARDIAQRIGRRGREFALLRRLGFGGQLRCHRGLALLAGTTQLRFTV